MKKRLLCALLAVVMLTALLPITAMAAELPDKPGLYVLDAFDFDGTAVYETAVEVEAKDIDLLYFAYYDGKTTTNLTPEDLKSADEAIVSVHPNLDHIRVEGMDVGKTEIQYAAPNGVTYSVSVTVTLPDVAFYTAPSATGATLHPYGAWNVQQLGKTLYLIAANGNRFAEVKAGVNWPESSITLSEDCTVAEIKLKGDFITPDKTYPYIDYKLEGQHNDYSRSQRFLDVSFGFVVDGEDFPSTTISLIPGTAWVGDFYYYQEGTAVRLTVDDLTISVDDIVALDDYDYDDTDQLWVDAIHCGTAKICYTTPNGTKHTVTVTVQLDDIDIYTEPVASEENLIVGWYPLTDNNHTVYLVSTDKKITDVTPNDGWPESNITISEDGTYAEIEIIGKITQSGTLDRSSIQITTQSDGTTRSYEYLTFEDYRGTPDTGKCGDNLTWKLDGRTLIISGTGAMYDYEYDKTTQKNTYPWVAFQDLIRKVVIEEGVTSVGNLAFSHCYNVQSIDLPDTLQRIGQSAFLLTYAPEIYIPANVTEIAPSAFAYSWALNSFTVDPANKAYSTDQDGALYNKEQTCLINIPYHVKGTYQVKEGVTAIESYAFHVCDSVETIRLPKSVTTLNGNPFCGMDALKAIIVDAGSTHFSTDSHGALYDKNKTKLIAVPTNIGSSYQIPSGVTTIGEYAFSWRDNADKLSITIPVSVTSIEEGAIVYEYITDIYYEGSQAQWNAITIGEYNGTLETAKIHIGKEDPVPCTHTPAAIPAVEPTCTADGLTEGSKCSKCGEILTKQETVPAKGHTEITDAAVEATCTKEGKTEGKHCSVCNEVLTKQEPVPVKAHTYTDGKCTVCGTADPDYQPEPDTLRGDMDNDGDVDSDDAIYLLRHTILSAKYPLTQSGDVDGDGDTDSDDAIYLLRHTILPSKYPLK